MMNQSKKKIDLQDYRSLESVARQNLSYILNHPQLFSQPENFSLIQYSNQSAIKNHIKGALMQIDALDPTASYLNIGMGSGFLEAVVDDDDLDWTFHSAEWDQQNTMFKQFRRSLNVDHYCKYIIKDVHSNAFELKVEKKYDYCLFIRFFPINKKWCNNIQNVMSKFVDVCNGFAIIDSPDNFKNWNRLVEVSDWNERLSDNGYSFLRYDSIDNFISQI